MMVSFWYVLLVVVLMAVIIFLWGNVNKLMGQMGMIKAFIEQLPNIKKEEKMK